MHRPSQPLLLAAALWLAATSCAVGGPSPGPAMPAARAALPPEYRIFYDTLEDEGDWTLIEPFGYVFRPDVNFVAWHPYERGFWVPSDVYGWVWISTEPFGWATYHYGRWMYDDYQGWVWLPGLDWAPAWVSWETTADYVGWAPLPPAGFTEGPLPPEATIWAPIGALGATDLSSRLVDREQIGAKLAEARPLRNVVERDGVRFNAGPPIEAVERTTGRLQRVSISEVGAPSRAGAADPARIEAMRRAGDEVAREARVLAKVGGPPPARVPQMKPVLPAKQRPPAAPAPADTTRR